MITCKLMGGLGNQLFQIFATIAYSVEQCDSFMFLKKEYYGIRPSYWTSLLSPLNLFTSIAYPLHMNYRRETTYNYTKIPNKQNMEKDIILTGYYQSYHYFENNYDMICRLIRLNHQKDVVINKNAYDYSALIGLHFRLGDYIALSEYHPIMTLEYYSNSIKRMIDHIGNNRLEFLYFCQKEDNEQVQETICELTKRYPCCTFEKVDDNIPDWEQLLMMSCCQHNIIANSSFSWWGAYFNQNIDKIVCYPNNWFGPKLAHNDTRDLCPTSWHRIE